MVVEKVVEFPSASEVEYVTVHPAVVKARYADTAPTTAPASTAAHVDGMPNFSKNVVNKLVLSSLINFCLRRGLC